MRLIEVFFEDST